MKRSIVRVALVTAALLLVPLVAMQFTDEVDWSPGDLLAAGALLVAAGVAYVSIAERSQSPGLRAAAGIAIGVVLVFVWGGLAI